MVGDHVTFGEEVRLDLGRDVDVILMRQDPPFDMAYVTSTHLLDRIHPDTLVVNDPFWVRNSPEKLMVLDFPDLTPPTMIARDPAALDPELARWTAFGASPRGTIALDRCARALAWLDGRDYVTPDDVRAMAFDVLRHRILLTFEAEAEGMTADTVIERLIERVPVSA